MNDEIPEQGSTGNPADEFPRCVPQCNRGGAKSLGTRGKVIFFLVVAVLAYAVLSETGPGAGHLDKASPSAAMAASSDNTASALKAMPDSWGAPLENLGKLNDVAADQDAVFVYVPDKETGPDGEIGRQIEKAADRARAAGLKMVYFMLDTASRDYTRVTSQVSVPCVLAMVKGRGTEVVSSDFSEGNLTRAMMTAWSASGGCCSR
ncbi:MAG: hypothetical protein ACLFOY_17385 [Desulfatibacillaceae bacterium]